MAAEKRKPKTPKRPRSAEKDAVENSPKTRRQKKNRDEKMKENAQNEENNTLIATPRPKRSMKSKAEEINEKAENDAVAKSGKQRRLKKSERRKSSQMPTKDEDDKENSSGNKPKQKNLKKRKSSEIREKTKKKFKKRRLSNVTKTKVDVNKFWFLKWEISSIIAMAVSPDGNFLVAARRSGCIELRLKKYNWETSFLVRWNIVDETSAVSAMAFDNSGSYVSVGRFNGNLDIYSVSEEGLAHHVRIQPGGGSVLSLASSPSGPFELAVGSEDGRVRFVKVDDEFVSLNPRDDGKDRLPTDTNHYFVLRGTRADGMCFSMDWKSYGSNPAGIIVCGDSLGGLRWIDGGTKDVLGRGFAPSNTSDCQIWTTQIVAEGTQVICGDSRGMVAVWCSKTFTKVEENDIEGMAGDIWSSGVIKAPDGTETVLLGCAGGNVASMSSLVSANGTVSWMPCRGRIVHSHDVRSIGVISNTGFVTASLDSRFCFFSKSNIDVNTREFVYPYHGAAGQNPNQFVPESSLILSRNEFEIDLWSTSNDSAGNPFMALRIKRPESFGSIVSYGTSSDATVLAVSSIENFSIFDLKKTTSENGPSVFTEVNPRSIDPTIEKTFRGAEHLMVLNDFVVGIAKDRQSLLVLTGYKLLKIRKRDIGSRAAFLTHLVGCVETGSIGVVDSRSNIYSAKLSETIVDGFKYLSSMGTGKNVSCIEFSRSGRTLAVSLMDCTLATITLVGEPTVGITKSFPSMLNSISFSSNDNVMLVSSSNTCYVTTLREHKKDDKGVTQLKKDNQCIVRKSSVLASGILSPSSICVVERKWETEFGRLPSVLPKKIYGF